MSDTLIRASVKNRPIRLFVGKTTDLCEKARKIHDLWPTSAAAFGRLASLALVLAEMNKDHEKVTVTVNGSGPIGTVLCVTRGDGVVKGFVGNPHCFFTNEKTGKLDVGYAVGKDGYLQVIRDLGLKDPFVSNVPLVSGEIGEDFAMYFAASEQIPTAVSVGVLVDTDNHVRASGVLVVQMMPGATDEDIDMTDKAIHALPAMSTLIDEGYTVEEIAAMMFADVEILGSQDLSYRCDCSKEHFAAALKTLGKAELEDIMAKDGHCEVSCQFCHTRYDFSYDELRTIVSSIE